MIDDAIAVTSHKLFTRLADVIFPPRLLFLKEQHAGNYSGGPAEKTGFPISLVFWRGYSDTF